jgi:hypothetical protein
MDQINFSKRALKNSTEFKSILQQTITGGGKLSPNMANRLSRELGHLNDILAGQAGNLSKAQKQAAINAARHVLEKNGINFTSNQLQDLLFPKDSPSKVNEPEEKEEKPVESLTSFDPNAIYGNEGAGPERWIRRSEQLNYMIAFENVDTAQAPAAVVRIVDTLDPKVYDLSNTSLGYVTVGDQFYRFEEDRKSFFRDIDLRPAKNLILRINAKVDTITGVLTWEFLSLDPATMELPIDPLIGFLPPNVNFPEGEGSVTFHTRLLPDVKHLDTASTSALIFFDENEPIRTNIWKHSVDEVAPTVSIDPNIRLDNDTTFTLTLRGSDLNSGLERFKLFVKPEGGVWNGYGFKGEDGLGVEILGEIGKSHEAYVLGIDSVGNASDSASTTPIRFTLVSIPPDNRLSAYMQVGPNPFDDVLNIYTPERNVSSIRLLDMRGRMVLQQDMRGQHERRLQLDQLSPGMYIVDAVLLSGEHITAKALKR